MKSILMIILIALAGSAYGQRPPTTDELQNTHWTLKKMLCESGLMPSPGIEKGTRYDVHFQAENNFEVLISMPETFSLVKGQYEFSSEGHLCLNEKFALTSGNPPFYYDRQTCLIHSVSATQMTWQFAPGEDCPAKDRQILIFEKQ